MTTSTTEPLAVDSIVLVFGYEFRVTRSWVVRPGLAHFVGACTADPRNDSIRHTGYNGGVYSKIISSPAT